MDRVRRLIHAQEEEIYPWDGSGITVAILDTGDCVKEMYSPGTTISQETKVSLA